MISMRLFRNSLYLATVLGHFCLDIFNSAGPVIVTFLSVPLVWSAAQIGLAVGAYQLASALSQPGFGWWADKVGSRWLGPGGVAWTIGLIVLSISVAQQTKSFLLFLIIFVVAGLGSGAFHPLGTKHAAEEAVHRAATGTAVFFLFGQTGLASGPVLAGLLLGTVGLRGFDLLALATVPVIIFMFYAMRNTRPELHPSTGDVTAAARRSSSRRWGAIVLLAILIGLRSWAMIGTVAFLPKLFQDMGWQPLAYGAITGAYWMSSAIIGVFAGSWADRWGRRPVTFVTLAAGAIALFFLPLYDSWVAFLLSILTGGLLGASHSVLVVIAQALLPGRPAFASGLTLGYLFGTGAVAAWGIGLLAEVWSLAVVIQAGAALALISAILALFLPTTRETYQPQTEGVPA
jgi:FSR family fosmidomycin resistance protein-like MFS transporter